MSDLRRGTKALELWCRRITDGYPGVKIENMTTSWKNGLGFCAIIHHFRPELIEFDKLDKKDIFYNNDLAFRTAETYLGIPALLEAVDMTEYEVPDRLSILTYLSQFHRVFGNQGSSPDRHKVLSTTKSLSPKPYDKTTTSTSTGKFSPTQSGIQKRELCFKCELPVFLAERFFYKNHLYHNSCLKCTKCNVQLIPGNIIESEMDNQLTCQSCTDKAMGMLLFDDDFDGGETEEFSYKKHEKSNDVLNKSVTDEEKHKSVREILNDFEKRNKTNIGKNKEVDNDDDDDDDEDDEEDEQNEDNNDKINNIEGVEDVDDIKNSKFDQQKNQSLMKFATQLLLTDNDNDIDNNDIKIDINKKITENIIINENDKILLNNNIDEIDKANGINVVFDNQLLKENEHKKENLNNIDCISSGADDNLIVNKNISNNKIIKINDDGEEAEEVKKEDVIEGEDDKDKENVEIKENDVINTTVDVDAVIIKNNDINDAVNEILLNELPLIEKNCDEEKCILDDKIIIIDNKNDKHDDDDFKISHSKNDDISSKEIENVEKIQIKETPIQPDIIEDEIKQEIISKKIVDDVLYPQSLNPFGDDDDDDIEDDKNDGASTSGTVPKPKPRISTNPFGDFSDDDDNDNDESLITPKLTPKRTPVPTPRKSLAIHNTYGSSQSINSLTTRHKKGKAPPPPLPMTSPPQPPSLTNLSLAPMHAQNALNIVSSKEQLFTPTDSQSNSGKSTPKLKKKRPAPTPPCSSTPIKQTDEPQTSELNSELNLSLPSMSLSTISTETAITNDLDEPLYMTLDTTSVPSKQRLIPLDASLMENNSEETKIMSEEDNQNIDYKRKLIPPTIEVIADDSTDDNTEDVIQSNENTETHNMELSERQMEKLKDNKESQNRNRQNPEPMLHANLDSSNLKWRHTKGQAPIIPICRISIRHELSNQEIKHELEVIKVQQQGLEKQGVMLEKMIRRRSEDVDAEALQQIDTEGGTTSNGRDVEDLIIQLFEIVNEKNELFRRQAELLNLRRQYRLEQEQADLEYKIRVSMAQPERNKTDTDKEREDTLIQRLVHVVQQRNEVVECFEMDRLREIEEDMVNISIKQSLELHTARRDTKLNQQTLTKLSKKEKKKLKEALKMTSHKKNKVDVDKDEDETEMPAVTKPKKHKFIKFSIIKILKCT